MLDQPALAVLDVWGNTYEALAGTARYFANLTHLRNSLVRHKQLLGRDAPVAVLHDKAYVGAHTLRTLADYLREVRNELLSKGVFLQAALAPGDLRVEAFSSGGVRGYRCLGEHVPRAYGQHGLLRAIAASLPYDSALAADVLNSFVVSCRFSHSTGDQLTPFLDVRFDDGDVTDTRLGIVLRSAMQYRARSRSTSRYFLPLLITIVRSINWSRVPWGASPAASEHRESVPPGALLLQALTGRRYDLGLPSVRGAHLLYFSLLDEVFASQEAIFADVCRVVVSRSNIFSKLDQVPSALLRDEARTAIADGHFDHHRAQARKASPSPKTQGAALRRARRPRRDRP